MEKRLFNKKYRIDTPRLKYHDYGSNGLYFVTICTKDRKPYFGVVRNGMLCFSQIGKYAYDCWYKIPDYYPFVKLHGFVVMPNHVHGVLQIAKRDTNNETFGNKFNVETQDLASLHRRLPNQTHNCNFNQFAPQSRNLPSIIRGYKIGVTKSARKIHNVYKWQPRYYESIIRNEIQYENIQRYITNNPLKWNQDMFYKRITL